MGIGYLGRNRLVKGKDLNAEELERVVEKRMNGVYPTEA